MTHSIPHGNPHVYFREIKQGERTSLSVVADLIAPHSHVLDLGCGSGALGRHLHTQHHCMLDGVTFNAAEAEHARPYYRRVEVADLETCDLQALFGNTRLYDAIVCADVLEHLRQPERILAACKHLLAPEGQLIISIPNAGYGGLVAELLMGEFLYREEGLLDRTHLRFFTRTSLERFLRDHAWALQRIETIDRALPDSEFRAPFDALPPSVARYLLAAPDASAYQFVAVAGAMATDGPTQAAPPPAIPPAQALFSAQLFHGTQGQFNERDKTVARGTIGVERQTLIFELPPIGDPPHYDTLRLDPADRSGFLHLRRITLHDAQDQTLWEWNAETGTAPLQAQPHRQISVAPPLPGSAAGLLFLYGTDPWLQLPIPAPLVARGRRLLVELGWPMSADYLALAAQVEPLAQRIDALHDALAEERSSQQVVRGQLSDTAARLAEANARLSDTIARTENLANQNHNLMEQRQGLLQEKRQAEHAAQHLRKDMEQLVNHLRFIENSTIFRATRPLVRAKMRLDRLLGRHQPPAPAQPVPQNQPLTPPSEPVDIIVPVYRGLADTQRCIASVLASRCTTPWRLIVINDASPEPEVTQWLRTCDDPRMVLLENTENLGFVATVNRGMAYSDEHDALLLNSDTEVANDWLDRLRQAAYSDARVATVTPFSTNATICSYPRFCSDNELPAGYDTARLDALFATTNQRQTLDIPTGVGFCMYIRRDSLRQLGLFDVETFGKGYGEENDYCLRATAGGWRNLLALDTFVLHTGGVSFGEAKSQRERDAMETLAKLHPHYARNVNNFVQADPIRPYRLAVDIARIT